MDDQTQPRRSRDQNWLWRERGFGFRFRFYPKIPINWQLGIPCDHLKRSWVIVFIRLVCGRICKEWLWVSQLTQEGPVHCEPVQFSGERWSSQCCVRKLVKPEPLSWPEGEPAGYDSPLFLSQISAMCSDFPQWWAMSFPLLADLVSVLSQQLKRNPPQSHEVSFGEFPFSARGSQVQSILLNRETKASVVRLPCSNGGTSGIFWVQGCCSNKHPTSSKPREWVSVEALPRQRVLTPWRKDGISCLWEQSGGFHQDCDG